MGWMFLKMANSPHEMKNASWFYLVAASAMEILWMLSMRFLRFGELRNIEWRHFFESNEGMRVLAPFIGYAVFGILNVVCISRAMKSIPMSVAFAVWMSLALLGSACVDAWILHETWNSAQAICLVLILLGVIGLQTTGQSKSPWL